MPRFAANISLLFQEYAFEDRFAAAARAGFKAVEILFPYDTPAMTLRRLLEQNELHLVLMNAPPPVTSGKRGFPAATGEETVFRAVMKDVLAYGQTSRPDLVHVMAGYERGAQARENFVQNLKWLADIAPDRRFAIEPLNDKDQPGYFLNDYGLAMEVLSDVNRPNVGLQYDTYHAQMIQGDAIRIWEEYGAHAVHVQIGAAPDRSEPGGSPVDFQTLFTMFD